MASVAMGARVFTLMAVVVAAYSLTMDEEATNNVIAAAGSAREGGEVAILVRAPHGKSSRREELLHAKADDDASISLYYNRKSNKVSLESLQGGHLKSVSWGLGSHPKGTLILVASSKRVKLYVGCKALHWHTMPTRHNLIELLSQQKLKMYHEESAPVEIYGNERAALDAISCEIQEEMRHPSLTTLDDETDVEDIKDFIEARKKREEEMQGDDYRSNIIDTSGVLPMPMPTDPQRGDIPSAGIETCDDEVIRQLQLLRQTIEQLRREVSEQKGTIDNLRGQLRQCCRAPPPVERCTGQSCYPGY